MAKKKAKGDAQANTENENANTKKEKGVSIKNATAEDAQATTRNAKTGKEKGTSRNLRARTVNKGDEIVDGKKGIDGSEAATEKGKGISTENAAAQDTQATTEDANTEKEKGTSSGRGKELVGVGEEAKGNNPSEVKEKPNEKKPIGSFWVRNTDGIPLIVDLPIQRIDTSEEAGDTPKTRDSSETLTENLALGGHGRNLSARAVNKGDEILEGKNGIDGSESDTGNATGKEIGHSWDSGRVVRSQSATTSGDKGKGKEVVIVGDKAEGKADGKKLMTDGIPLIVDLPIQRIDTSEEAGDTPKTRDSGETVSEKLVSAVNKGDEIAGAKKGIDGSEAAKKATGKKFAAPKVGHDNDVVKAVTSTSAKVQEGEAVVSTVEKQSEKNGNAEDGEGRGKSEKRGRDENVAVRRGPPRKSRKDLKNKK